MSDWKNFSLGDVCNFIDYRGKTPPKVKSGIPLVTAKIIKNGFIQEPQEFIAEEFYSEWMRRGIPKKGDVVFTTEAPLGEVAQIKTDRKLAFAQRVIILESDNDVLCSSYLFYALRDTKLKSRIEARQSGTTVSGIKASELKKVEVDLPPLETQKKIAAVLSALDDKIELNNAINKNLEEQAQTIYKNMFVDNFNPAWKSGTLSDIVDVRDGTHDSPKKVDDKFFLITSKHLLPFGVEISSANTISEKDFNKINERSAVNKHDILFSMIGTVGIISFVIESDINFAIKNVGLIKTSEKPQYKYYLLSYLKSNFMRQYIERVLAGTTQKYISLAELRKIPVNFSDSQTLNEYNVRVEPIFLKIAANIQENQKLGEIRDLLLPRLMSGEIDVSSVEA